MRTAIAFLLLVSLARPADGPRPQRVLFFHAAWCGQCRPALEGKDAFPDWLKQAGWKIGDTSDCHVQIIDVDSRDDLAMIHGVTTLPAIAVIGEKSIPYEGRQSLVNLLLKPSAAKESRTVSSIHHEHRCSGCGTAWWHGPENNGSATAHTCPKCGRQQFQQTGRTRAVSVEVPVVKTKPVVRLQSVPMFRAGCPSGNCPYR